MFGNLFNPSKWTLGTLFDAAGAAGGLITGGVLPGSQALGAGLIGAGMFGSGNQQPSYAPGDTENRLKDLTSMDLDFILNNSGKRYQALNNAYDALDPQNNAANANYYQNSLLRNADLTGRRNAGALRDRGYGSGVADAAMLDARNSATMQGNDYFAMLSNPVNRAGQYMQQANTVGNMGMFQNSLSGLMGLQTQKNNQRLSDLYYEQNRPASTLESGVGLLGQLAPYLFPKNSGSGGKIYDEPVGPMPYNYGDIANGILGAFK